jgi:hypothetical protein
MVSGSKRCRASASTTIAPLALGTTSFSTAAFPRRIANACTATPSRA